MIVIVGFRLLYLVFYRGAVWLILFTLWGFNSPSWSLAWADTARSR